eukprot:gb/GECG01015767.1/.p1 GENE.gb/GECG01015767.1/~~gb/GECG01015767.1/.p1  ORF type:complete len:335 (+),score=34.09 gb/GECG01015767.1/:1-1005(+)
MSLARRIVRAAPNSSSHSPTVQYLDTLSPHLKTAYVIHGLLGSSRNWLTLARQWSKRLPDWQFVLVDLPGHGESHPVHRKPVTVESAASQVIELFEEVASSPAALIGHSLGGKVVLSIVEQLRNELSQPGDDSFRTGNRLAAFALDTVPGTWDQRANDNDQDSVLKIVDFVENIEYPLQSRDAVVRKCLKRGFSREVANWMTTNIKNDQRKGTFEWVFDITTVKELYESHIRSNKWGIICNPPASTCLNLVMASRSSRWYDDQVRQDLISASRYASNPSVISRLGLTAPDDNFADVVDGQSWFHIVDSGHWIHVESPEQLFREVLQPIIQDMEE